MSLTREEVLKVAKLAKLEFDEEKIKEYQNQLNDILGYIDILNEVDTAEVEPLVYINEEINNFREEERKESVSLEKALLNAPEVAESAIVVPKVIGE